MYSCIKLLELISVAKRPKEGMLKEGKETLGATAVLIAAFSESYLDAFTAGKPNRSFVLRLICGQQLGSTDFFLFFAIMSKRCAKKRAMFTSYHM